MKNFCQWLTVEEIGGRFAVVRREKWDLGSNAVMADGPFDDRGSAEREKDLIEKRERLSRERTAI